MGLTIAIAAVCFAVGAGLSYVFFRYGLKTKYDNILKEAETEAEVIKKNKLLEVKEKFLNKKADLEKEVALRNQKIQQVENKLKQREMVLNQKQEEVQRKHYYAKTTDDHHTVESAFYLIKHKAEEGDMIRAQCKYAEYQTYCCEICSLLQKFHFLFQSLYMHVTAPAAIAASRILKSIVSTRLMLWDDSLSIGLPATDASYLAKGLDHITSPSGKYAVKRAYGSSEAIT